MLISRAELLGPPDPEHRYRLLELVRRRGRERRFSERTIVAYVHWIRRFVVHFGRRHPRELGVEHVREFLSFLTTEQNVAASTHNQALAALTFLYGEVLRAPFDRMPGVLPASRPRRAPTVLSQAEIGRLLEHLDGPPRLAVLLMYGSGLRVLECVTLRVKDVDLDRRELVVRAGKGEKDRRAPLATTVAPLLKRYLRERERLYFRDLKLEIRCTGLTPAIERKYPRASLSWPWSYVFPARRTLIDAHGARRRHHLHATVVQRALSRAAQDARLTKRVSCHALRRRFRAHGQDRDRDGVLVDIYAEVDDRRAAADTDDLGWSPRRGDSTSVAGGSGISVSQREELTHARVGGQPSHIF